MDPRVNLIAVAVIVGFFLLAAGSLLLGWVRAGRVDLLPTLILTAFGLIVGLILTFFYHAMEDRRGIIFFGTFFGLILLPQFALYVVLGPQAWKESSRQQSAAPPGIDVPTITDLDTRSILDSTEAKLATYSDGTQVLKVRYTDAETAAARLHAEYGGNLPPLTRLTGHEGVFVETQGIASFQFQDSAQVIRVSGPNRAGLERRLEASSSTVPERLTERAGPTDIIDRIIAKAGPVPILVGVLVYTLFIAWVFFRLSAWAASFPAPAGVASAPATTLRERLLDVGRAEVPFTVKPGNRPDELIAEWRYADATWFDLMRAHRMTQMIRYRLRLDETDRTVRVLEYRAAFDASAGIGGATLNYRVQRGITFFEIERYTVLGLQIKDGRVTPDLSYSWRFDVDELRNPLIRIVHDAGWNWRQVMLDIKWLTAEDALDRRTCSAARRRQRRRKR
jgi:hypothetical protein